MSCSPKEYGQENKGTGKGSDPGKWRQIGIGLVTALCMFGCVVEISRFWMREPWAAPKKNWEQMSGNDGKFYKGTPDDSVYGDMEGVKCTFYYQYFYDNAGRLSRINTFRPHDYYEDVWVLSDEETYEYDKQGRIVRRSAISGGRQWVCEYTEEGRTETMSWKYRSNALIYAYDSSDNCIFFRNADNYAYPRVTTYEYDEKNRKVREILEVEGKSPYGKPPSVILSIAYDDENHTSVETEYDWDGEVTRVWYNTYDGQWRKTGSSWYAVEDIPKGYSAEECADYYTRGYWASYDGELLMEEMSNEPWKTSQNKSKYCAYDYDGSGNCILKLEVYGIGFVRMDRYVYADGNRLTEQYHYNLNNVTFWERMQSDGSRLTLKNADGEPFSITRTALDGTLINRFEYGESRYEVDIQYTAAETIYWQNSPSLMPAEKQDSGSAEPEQQKPEKETPHASKAFLYTVKQGDCLWSIAEKFMGDGQKYRKIYRQNSDVIDNPGLILPGMRLYIETE